MGLRIAQRAEAAGRAVQPPQPGAAVWTVLRRVFGVAAVAVLAALLPVACLYGQQRKPANPKGGRNPRPAMSALERLNGMTPDQRRRMLEKLPPDRKRQIESRLENYNQLPGDQRQRLREQYEIFHHFPPERQDKVRVLYRRYSKLPSERRTLLREEILQLRNLEDNERQSRMESPEFRKKYGPAEMRLLDGLSGLLPPPDAATGADRPQESERPEAAK